jgi:mlo protein
MAGGAGGRDLPSTPTWAVAVVCAVIVLVSVAMEHGLHKLGHVRHSFPTFISHRMRAC